MRPRRTPFLFLAALAALSAPVAARARDLISGPVPRQDGDALWTLFAAMLAMAVQAGFAALATARSRPKEAGDVPLRILAGFAVAVPAFSLIGFGLMFGDDVAGFAGWSGFGLSGSSAADAAGLWPPASLFFQAILAATAVAVVTGAMAGQARAIVLGLGGIATAGLVYPVAGHWIWGGGWLSELDAPMIDFAGGAVIHSLGGWLALSGLMRLGPGDNAATPAGTDRIPSDRSPTLEGLGGFLLWSGWLGCTIGLAFCSGGDVGHVAMTSTLASCMAALAAMATARLRRTRTETSMGFRGLLAGLAALAAGCANFSPTAALIIGGLAGILVVLSVDCLAAVFRIDDPVSAVSVHGVCGTFGVLCAGLFADPDFGGVAGLFYGGGLTQPITQIIGAGAIFVWGFGCGLILFALAHITLGLRASIATRPAGSTGAGAGEP